MLDGQERVITPHLRPNLVEKQGRLGAQAPDGQLHKINNILITE